MGEAAASSTLPGILGEIAGVAGETAALAIARARGGTQVYFPVSPSPDHWLSQLIGQERATAVCAHLTCEVGGRRVDVPLGPAGHLAKAGATIEAMLAADRSERDIALATGYTTRAIRYRRARLKSLDDRQLSLM